MKDQDILTALAVGLLVGAIAVYTIVSPKLGRISTSTSIITTTETTSATVTASATISANQTVTRGTFIIPPNTTLPTSSALGFNASVDHTGVIISSFVVTNETYLSMNIEPSNGLGGGCDACYSFEVEVIGFSGQILYQSTQQYGNVALTITLPPSPQTAGGLESYYLDMVNLGNTTMLIEPNAYLY